MVQCSAVCAQLYDLHEVYQSIVCVCHTKSAKVLNYGSVDRWVESKILTDYKFIIELENNIRYKKTADSKS